MPSRPIVRVARLLAALAVVATGIVVAAHPALAGGPTSALLVSPSTGRAAALYYSDPEYDQLFTALGGYDPTSDPAVAPTPGGVEPSVPGAAYVTVTWLIHDVSVWRIDRIFLTADAPVIVTELSDGDQNVASGMYPGEAGDDRAVWHAAPDPVALLALLSTLDLVNPAQPRTAGDSDAADSDAVGVGAAANSGNAAYSGSAAAGNAAAGDAAAAADRTAEAAATIDPTVGPGLAWWWALTGAAVGIVLTAAAVRFVPAIRRRMTTVEDDPDHPVRMIQIPA
jgi:hypothetical protein